MVHLFFHVLDWLREALLYCLPHLYLLSFLIVYYNPVLLFISSIQEILVIFSEMIHFSLLQVPAVISFRAVALIIHEDLSPIFQLIYYHLSTKAFPRFS